jgi:TonB-linked outer membrane protein, SusC/RagA family
MRKLIYLFLCIFISIGYSLSQTKTVTGIVISEDDGEPVMGATVIVKEQASIGTITDIDGNFSLSIPENAKTLKISYVGMNPLEVTADTQNRMRIVLSSNIQLEEVVVTAMGVLRSARSVGYGQTVVNPDEAIQKAEPDLFRALQGKMPGVQINASSSTPGSATKIVIRGSTSFFGDNQPLYIVDGVPYSNPEYETGNRLTSGGAYGTGLSTLDPNDIESMDVLKGAAAAALYGSRAANGVIMITTKSGSKKVRPSQKKFEVTVTSSLTTEKIASLPEYQNTYGQGSSFLYSNANGSWGPAFGGDLKEIPTWSNYLAAYPDMAKTQPYQAYPNNVSGLFNTGAMWDNSVNIMSQNDKGNLSVTVSNLTQEGIVPHSEFKRNSFSVGGNQKLDNGITVGGNISYSKSVQDGPMFGAGNYGGSISSFARTMLMPRNIDAVGLPYETPDGKTLMPFSASTVDNPLWSWKNNTNNTISERIITNVNAGYDFTKWLTAYYQFGWNQLNTDRKTVTNIGSVGPSEFVGLGQIINDDYKYQEIESNFNLTFKHKFFDNDLDLRVTAGHNVNQVDQVNKWAQGSSMIFPEIYNVGNTLEQTAGESHSKRRLWALYADVQLGYKNYAFLGFTMRNDHSSTLPVENNSYYYPSVSGSFIFSDFFEINPSVLNYGKVRASWGKTGRDASPYYVNGTFSRGTPFNSRPLMSYPTTTYDPELKPEFSSEFDLGTELMFFNSRIGIDFTWYSKMSSNQIAYVSLPASTGSSTYWTNYGEVSNKGIELLITLVPIDMRNSLRWSILGTFTKNKNEVLSLTYNGMDQEQITLSTGSSSEPQPTIKVGYPFAYLRGSVIARDTDGTPLINPSAGSFMEATELGDLGDPNPDFQTSITNTIKFKGFVFSAMFDARVGGVIVSGPASDMLGRGVTKDTEDRLGTRILYGVYADPNTHKPILDGNGNRIMNTVQMSENDLWFASDGSRPTFAMNSVDEFSAFDATVLRLSEISLGYDVPSKFLKKTFIGSASISVIARNLWHYAPGFPKYSNYDPGSNSFGSGNVQAIDKESAPSVRRFGLNVKLTF